jgi:hypothetical protein
LWGISRQHCDGRTSNERDIDSGFHVENGDKKSKFEYREVEQRRGVRIKAACVLRMEVGADSWMQ